MSFSSLSSPCPRCRSFPNQKKTKRAWDVDSPADMPPKYVPHTVRRPTFKFYIFHLVREDRSTVYICIHVYEKWDYIRTYSIILGLLTHIHYFILYICPPLFERWSSLTYIRKNVDEMRSRAVAQWHEMEIHEREISRRGYYIPRTKKGISLVLGSAPKNYASRFYQLKVGHGVVGIYLARIGVIEAPDCWWCKEVVQSVEHLYTRCRKWRRERRKPVRELEK